MSSSLPKQLEAIIASNKCQQLLSMCLPEVTFKVPVTFKRETLANTET